MSTSQDEVERTFDVDATTILPTLADVDGVFAMAPLDEVNLMAVYFDTAELDLARHGITLRRRTGGNDQGWHLKLPKTKDTRTEVHLPLGRATKRVPAALLTPVRALVRDRPLAPIAEVSTRRLQYRLLDAEKAVLALVCDDEVHAERLHGASRVEDWREWEVEVVEGSEALLDAVDQRLVAAGASPGSASSKLARALGDVVPPPPEKPSRKQLASGTAAQLLLTHVSEQTRQLWEQDARLRLDQPGSVHKLRIAARRLRSALQTYRPLLDSETARSLATELRWLGLALSQARDAQVMRERLHLLVSSEPPELVLGPVSNRIDDDLGAEYQAGREQAVEALDTERYFRLLDALDDLLESPPLTSKADAPAKELLPRLLHRDTKRLRRAVREVDRTHSAEEQDLALHEARKKAKRLRYAAESAVPVFRGRAKTLAASAKAIQQALGEHQDSVVTRHRLREYGARTHSTGENGFTFGRLHALEQVRADKAEREFEKAWADFPRKRFRG